MDGYLNEAEAYLEIEDTIKGIRKDFKIHVYGRVPNKSLREKTVTFILIITQDENNEEVFDALMKKRISTGEKLKLVSSTAQLHESKRIVQDVFKIEAEIQINC